MFYSRLTIYLTVLFSIISCDSARITDGNLTYLKPKEDKGTPVIILFHGLGSSASCFNTLQRKLEEAFPNASVLALTSVNGAYTLANSIKEQASSTFQELSEKIISLQNRPMLLIGHSQGGLRAYKMFDLYKDLLNVKGIITLATPWEGAPILLSQSLLSEYCQHPAVLDDMQKFSLAYHKEPDFLREKLQSLIELSPKGDICAGVIDLTPKSSFLNWVAGSFSSVKVPILALGGAQSDFRVFLSEQTEYDFKVLCEAWSKIIIGTTSTYNEKNKAHDMVVPLYSQMALNIVPRENKNFKRVIIPDAIHDSLLSDENTFHNILEHPLAFEEIKNFAKSLLGQVSNPITHELQDNAEAD